MGRFGFARHVATCALTSSLLLGASHAHASEAERLFQLGRRASEMGKYATACSLFRESQRLEPAVGTLLNLGDCEEQQNHVAAALDYYQEALGRMQATDDRLGPLRTRIEAIEQRSGKMELKLGEGAPPETQVVVDGEVVSAEKRKKPIMVSAGGHLVQVTAVGYRGSRQWVDVTAGALKSVVIWPGPPLEATELALASEDPRAGERKRAARDRALRTVGFVTLGASAASLWVGSVTGILAIDRESLRSDHCNAQNQCDRTGVDAARSGNTFATWSTITLGAGAALAGAGLWLILTNPPSNEGKDGKDGAARNPLAPTRVGAIPLPAGAAVSIAHSF